MPFTLVDYEHFITTEEQFKDETLLDQYFNTLFQCNTKELNLLLKLQSIKGKQNLNKADKIRAIAEAHCCYNLREDYLDAYIFKYSKLKKNPCMRRTELTFLSAVLGREHTTALNNIWSNFMPALKERYVLSQSV